MKDIEVWVKRESARKREEAEAIERARTCDRDGAGERKRESTDHRRGMEVSSERDVGGREKEGSERGAKDTGEGWEGESE